MNGRRITKSMRDFDTFIGEIELRDPPLTNGVFTWSNGRSRAVCKRFGRFLFSVGW